MFDKSIADRGERMDVVLHVYEIRKVRYGAEVR